MPALARLRRRLPSAPSPERVDAWVAVGLALLATLWLGIRWVSDRGPSSPAVLALGLLLGLPLAWRRRSPLAVLAVVTPATVLYGEVGGPEGQWAVNIWLLAAFSAGAYGEGRWRDPIRAAASVAFAGYIASIVLREVPAWGGASAADRLTLLFRLAGNAALLVWVWWFGDTARIRLRRERQLAERTRQLEREREENARRAILDERVRIARELHDVVAHHVSLMGVQAGAARRVLRRRPDQAEHALAAIEASSRDAVRELHRLLGFLRRDGDADGLAPQPGLGALDDLLAQMRAAGLPVAVEVEGEPTDLPPATDLSAYRIAQEALTNTLRHAGPATATVRLRYGPRDLTLEVVDDGRGPAPAGPVGGRDGPSTPGGVGLVGMRERAALLGGSLLVERPADGGFAVRAVLPLDRGPA